jgi:putative transcriptional regulator
VNVLSKLNIKKGKVLISPPLAGDDFFHNSVVLLTEYAKEGVVGFIVNKPVELGICDLIAGFPKFEAQVYCGGPVASDNLYFIHRAPDKIEDSVHIIDDLYWGGNFDQVTKLIRDGKLKSEEIRFFLGYSGWEIDQLGNEIDSNSWIVDELDNSLFDWDVVELWKNCLYQKGQKYKIWADAPVDIRLN